MSLRTRLAAILAVSLLAAGTAALLVNVVIFENAPYPTWQSYSDELLTELDVSREGVIEALERDPNILFDTPGDTRSWNGVTIDDASRAVQERAIRRAVDDSRRLTAIAVLAVLAGSLIAAWLFGRRLLGSIRRITAGAQRATASDPGDRIALEGPDDEIKELADTFDDMLDRIGRAHDAQRRFSAQVSHELRTPLSVTASEVEMLLDETDDPMLTRRLRTIADSTARVDRLVQQLLVLSRTQTGLLERETIALDDLVGEVLGRTVEQPEWRHLRLDFDVDAVTTTGDRALLDSMIRNLLENAGRHNHPGGWVRVDLGTALDGETAMLEISNSVRDELVAVADEPGRPRTGLTIVAAVLDAHGGDIEWDRGDGHVTVRITLQGVPVHDRSATGSLTALAARATAS